MRKDDIKEYKERRKEDRCRLRLCKAVGNRCPHCGRLVFKAKKDGQAAPPHVPIEHGI